MAGLIAFKRSTVMVLLGDICWQNVAGLGLAHSALESSFEEYVPGLHCIFRIAELSL